MKRTLLICSSIAMLALAACSTATPDAGHQAVWVEKPVFFGHGGVDANPVTTGQEYGAITSTAVDVNMQPQRVDMEFDDMMTKSGVPVSFHVLFTFKVTDAVKLVQNYGVDSNGEAKSAWNRVMDSQINQLVRDSVKIYDMQDIAISQVAVDDVTQRISKGSYAIAGSTGMPIQLLSVNVGRILPPDAVRSQRIETAAQEQRVITEQQRKLAEDSRRAAELSRASADNAYQQEMHLTPDQFVQLQNIQMEKEVCSHGGCTFFVGGHPTPTLNLK